MDLLKKYVPPGATIVQVEDGPVITWPPYIQIKFKKGDDLSRGYLVKHVQLDHAEWLLYRKQKEIEEENHRNLLSQQRSLVKCCLGIFCCEIKGCGCSCKGCVKEKHGKTGF